MVTFCGTLGLMTIRCVPQKLLQCNKCYFWRTPWNADQLQ